MKQCYLSGYGRECSNKISKEHFISRNILEFISHDGGSHIGGMPWQPPRTLQSLGINSLVQKNLCESHNNNLTELDRNMGNLFRRIHCINKRALLIKPNALFKGSTIERWLLKVLCGLHHKKVGSIALNLLLNEDGLWPDGWGLYMPINSTVVTAKEVSWGPLHHPVTQEVVGGNFTVCGIPFTLLLYRPDDPQAYGKYRPRGLIFNEGFFERRIEFGWHFEANEAIHYKKIGHGSSFIPNHHRGWNTSI